MKKLLFIVLLITSATIPISTSSADKVFHNATGSTSISWPQPIGTTSWTWTLTSSGSGYFYTVEVFGDPFYPTRIVVKLSFSAGEWDMQISEVIRNEFGENSYRANGYVDGNYTTYKAKYSTNGVVSLFMDMQE